MTRAESRAASPLVRATNVRDRLISEREDCASKRLARQVPGGRGGRGLGHAGAQLRLQVGEMGGGVRGGLRHHNPAEELLREVPDGVEPAPHDGAQGAADAAAAPGQLGRVGARQGAGRGQTEDQIRPLPAGQRRPSAVEELGHA